jgi:hypothetical protein
MKKPGPYDASGGVRSRSPDGVKMKRDEVRSTLQWAVAATCIQRLGGHVNVSQPANRLLSLSALSDTSSLVPSAEQPRSTL